MTYPNTDWPGSLDGPQTRTNNVDVVYANDFNYPDEQIRAVQDWLGDGQGDFIGDTGTAADGTAGIASPVADTGVAFTIAAKEDFTSGKLLSVGDDYDSSYSEKFYIGYDGAIWTDSTLQLSATIAVDEILDEDDLTSDSATALATQQSIKKYVDDEVLGVAGYWQENGTVLSPVTSGRTAVVGDGSSAVPGLAFEGYLTSGVYAGSGTVGISVATSTKLQATAAGVGVSDGTVTTSGLYFLSAGSAAGFSYASNVISSSVGSKRVVSWESTTPGTDPGELKIYHTNIDASPHGEVEVSYLTFSGVDASLNPHDYARISAFAVDDAATSEDGRLNFWTAKGTSSGALINSWSMSSTTFEAVGVAGAPWLLRNVGSAAAPVYTFNGSTSTGHYLDSGAISTSIGGYRTSSIYCATPGTDPGELRIYHSKTTLQASPHNVSYLTFSGTDDGGNPQDYARIKGYATSTGNPNEAGAIYFQVAATGTLDTRWEMGANYFQSDATSGASLKRGAGTAGTPSHTFVGSQAYGRYLDSGRLSDSINGYKATSIGGWVETATVVDFNDDNPDTIVIVTGGVFHGLAVGDVVTITGSSNNNTDVTVVSIDSAKQITVDAVLANDPGDTASITFTLKSGDNPGRFSIYHTDNSNGGHGTGIVSFLDFVGYDDGTPSVENTYARIVSSATDVGAGAEDGNLAYYLSVNGVIGTPSWTMASNTFYGPTGGARLGHTDTAAAPAHSWTGSTNFGVFLDTAEVAISVGGYKTLGVQSATPGTDPGELKIYHTNNPMAGAGNVTLLSFSGYNSASEVTDFAQITTYAHAVTDGGEIGHMKLQGRSGATMRTMALLHPDYLQFLTYTNTVFTIGDVYSTMLSPTGGTAWNHTIGWLKEAPGNDADVGYLTFRGRDDSTNDCDYAQIAGNCVFDADSSGERGALVFSLANTVLTGALEEVAKLQVDSGAYGELVLRHPGTNTHDGLDVSYLTFSGIDNGSAEAQYARLIGHCDGHGAGAESGSLIVKAANPLGGGALETCAVFKPSSTTLYSGGGEILATANAAVTMLTPAATVLPMDLVVGRLDTPGGATDVGYLTFRGKDGSGNDQDYARITGYGTTVTHTSEAGRFEFDVAVSGSLSKRWTMDSAALYGGTGSAYIKQSTGSESNPEHSFSGNLGFGMGFISSTSPDQLLFSADGYKVATLETAAVAGEEPGELKLWHTYAAETSHIGDTSYLSFVSFDANDAPETYARIVGVCVDDTAATTGPDGGLDIDIDIIGTLTTAVEVRDSGTTGYPGFINEKQTVTSSSAEVDVDCEDGLTVYHLLTETTEIQVPTNPVDGMELLFIIIQTNSSWVVTWDTTAFKGTVDAIGSTSGSTALVVGWVRSGGYWLLKYSEVVVVSAA